MGTFNFAASNLQLCENGGDVLNKCVNGFEADTVASSTILRTGGEDGLVRVYFSAYSSGSNPATRDVDWSVSSTFVDFGAGETSKALPFLVLQDDIYEDPDENFRFLLTSVVPQSMQDQCVLGSEPVCPTIGPTPQQTITLIDDNDGGFLSFSSLVFSFSENNPELRMYVSRTGGSSGTVQVELLYKGGTATPDVDFLLPSENVVTVRDGETSGSLGIPLLNDELYEIEETLIFELGEVFPRRQYNPSEAAAGIIEPSQCLVKIADDADEGTFQFKSESFSFREDDSLAAVIVERLNGSSGSVAVRVQSLGGTATVGVDFTAVDETVEFADGVTEMEVALELLNDPTFEPEETVELQLSNGEAKGRMGAILTTTVTILDDRDSGTFLFEEPLYEVAEDAGAVTLTVLRTGLGSAVNTYSSRDVSVYVESVSGYFDNDPLGLVEASGCFNGSTPCIAEAGVDYSPLAPTELQFVEGQTSVEIVITIHDDDTLELPDQLFEVCLHTPSEGAYVGGLTALDPVCTVVRILDDRDPGLLLSKTSVVVSEAGDTDSFSVWLNSVPATPVTVNILWDGSPSLLSVSPRAVVFSAINWNLPATVAVSAPQDDAVEEVGAYNLTIETVSFDPLYTDVVTGRAVRRADVYHQSKWTGTAPFQSPADNTVVVFVVDDDFPAVLLQVENSPSGTGGVPLIRLNGTGSVVLVSLLSAPSEDVTVEPRVAQDSGAAFDPESVVFNSSNWSTPQRVIVSSPQPTPRPSSDDCLTHSLLLSGHVQAVLPVLSTESSPGSWLEWQTQLAPLSPGDTERRLLSLCLGEECQVAVMTVLEGGKWKWRLLVAGGSATDSSSAGESWLLLRLDIAEDAVVFSVDGQELLSVPIASGPILYDSITLGDMEALVNARVVNLSCWGTFNRTRDMTPRKALDAAWSDQDIALEGFLELIQNSSRLNFTSPNCLGQYRLSEGFGTALHDSCSLYAAERLEGAVLWRDAVSETDQWWMPLSHTMMVGQDGVVVPHPLEFDLSSGIGCPVDAVPEFLVLTAAVSSLDAHYRSETSLGWTDVLSPEPAADLSSWVCPPRTVRIVPPRLLASLFPSVGLSIPPRLSVLEGGEGDRYQARLLGGGAKPAPSIECSAIHGSCEGGVELETFDVLCHHDATIGRIGGVSANKSALIASTNSSSSQDIQVVFLRFDTAAPSLFLTFNAHPLESFVGVSSSRFPSYSSSPPTLHEAIGGHTVQKATLRVTAMQGASNLLVEASLLPSGLDWTTGWNETAVTAAVPAGTTFIPSVSANQVVEIDVSAAVNMWLARRDDSPLELMVAVYGWKNSSCRVEIEASPQELSFFSSRGCSTPPCLSSPHVRVFPSGALAVSAGASAVQSSTGYASLATDGIVGPSEEGLYAMRARPEMEPFLDVDLGRPVAAESVELWFRNVDIREEILQLHVWILASEEPFGTSSLGSALERTAFSERFEIVRPPLTGQNSGQLDVAAMLLQQKREEGCFWLEGEFSNCTQSLRIGASIRHVRVQVEGVGYLQVAEVIVRQLSSSTVHAAASGDTLAVASPRRSCAASRACAALLTFSPRSPWQPLVVVPIDDLIGTGSRLRTVKHQLWSADGDYSNFSAAAASVLVHEDDLAGVRIAASFLAVREGAHVAHALAKIPIFQAVAILPAGCVSSSGIVHDDNDLELQVSTTWLQQWFQYRQACLDPFSIGLTVLQNNTFVNELPAGGWNFTAGCSAAANYPSAPSGALGSCVAAVDGVESTSMTLSVPGWMVLDIGTHRNVTVDEIRFFQPAKARGSASVKCALVQVPIAAPPSFSSLDLGDSAWKNITADPVCFSVTATLEKPSWIAIADLSISQQYIRVKMLSTHATGAPSVEIAEVLVIGRQLTGHHFPLTEDVELTALSRTHSVGTTAAYSVQLDSQPLSTVTITAFGADSSTLLAVHASNTAAIEGCTDSVVFSRYVDVERDVLLPTCLVFTELNWNVPQWFTVSAVDDNIGASSAQTAPIGHSASSRDSLDAIVTHIFPNGSTSSARLDPTQSYATGATFHTPSGEGSAVRVAIEEDDVSGVTLSTVELQVLEGEAVGYSVVLDSQPLEPVTVTVSFPSTLLQLSTKEVVFLEKTWNLPQTVTVLALNDSFFNGTVPFAEEYSRVSLQPAPLVLRHRVNSGDPQFASLEIPDILASVLDANGGCLGEYQCGPSGRCTDSGRCLCSASYGGPQCRHRCSTDSDAWYSWEADCTFRRAELVVGTRQVPEPEMGPFTANRAQFPPFPTAVFAAQLARLLGVNGSSLYVQSAERSACLASTKAECVTVVVDLLEDAKNSISRLTSRELLRTMELPPFNVQLAQAVDVTTEMNSVRVLSWVLAALCLFPVLYFGVLRKRKSSIQPQPG